MGADRAGASVIELKVKRFVVNRGAAIIPNVIYVAWKIAKQRSVRSAFWHAKRKIHKVHTHPHSVCAISAINQKVIPFSGF